MTAIEKLRGPWTLPNFITLLRLAALPFFLFSISEGNVGIALVIFVAAGISDGIDGFLARRFDMKSALGATSTDRRQAADDGLYLFLAIPSFRSPSRCLSGSRSSSFPGTSS
jgi:hypothetical protein